MTDIRLLDKVNADTETASPSVVSAFGGVNVYSAFDSLGGGTLNIYETPDPAIKPKVPIYSSTTGEPKHLNVTPGSYMIGELIGATNPANVTLGVMTRAIGSPNKA